MPVSVTDAASLSSLLPPTDSFARRHNGPDATEQERMLKALGLPSLDALIDAAVPADIRRSDVMSLPAPLGESAALAELAGIAAANQVFTSFIGQGYYGTHTPSVIQRTILENPGWYTAYTPYQAEISQGRLEALLNFQTLVTDLTGLEIAGASMLDEGTAAAEAMMMAHRLRRGQGTTFFASEKCHPQTIDIVRTRAEPLGLTVIVGDHRSFTPDATTVGVLVQYPDTTGDIEEFGAFFAAAHEVKAHTIVATDLLALTLLKPPGAFGADIAVGSAQRFGVPLGYGGPHAGFLATKDTYKRQMPGRLVGVSRDRHGNPALRLALGTREQHIRRDKATSNICTAQVLLAVMASMYAVYHGPDGLRRIARRTKLLTEILAAALRKTGATVNTAPVFDTLTVSGIDAANVHAAAQAHRLNLRRRDATSVGVSVDETTTLDELVKLLACFDANAKLDVAGVVDPEGTTSVSSASRASAATTDRTEPVPPPLAGVGDPGRPASPPDSPGSTAPATKKDVTAFPLPFARETGFLAHPVFNQYHTEHELLRYIKQLEAKDLSLCHSMISLGSCTMKLNAASEMFPVSWPEIGQLHPFAPPEQTRGYQRIITDLETWLGEITGLAAVSLQPNAGSQGEYAGLLAIRAYHASRGDGHRDVCLIPTSAHGTNPASAVMGGMKVVPVACDDQGNIDLPDLQARIADHAANLGALMITYPSTHGVFESTIREICQLIHDAGGQVYMDGANMNAQVGITSPGHIGADVCHLNLHKTFCIPHGGGGPGVGPIAVARHLAPFLPGHPAGPSFHPESPLSTGSGVGAVSAAPYGSASILVISWMYIRMMGATGLTEATRLAILNANYLAKRLAPFFPVLYRGNQDLVAHECIIDLRAWKAHGLEVEDAAKRLMDYGFHAPTMSWPVAGTFMIEPTESESLAELDRFCDALIAIHGEMQAVVHGESDAANNPLVNAPHTAQAVTASTWTHPYSRDLAAFPSDGTRQTKFWPAVGRVDNVYGDRNLVCSCAGMEAYA